MKPIISAPTPEVLAAVSTEWSAYIDPLRSIAERVAKTMPDPANPHLRQEMYRQLFSLIAAGYWSMLFQDPDNPDFTPFFYNYGAPNPDDLYTVTPIRGNGTYKISGTRGSTHIVTISVVTGDFVLRGTGEQWGPTVADNDVDELEIGKDGYFEVILSAERPAGHTGNWWKLDPRGTWILVRQRYYDWRNEVPGRLAIQRLDQPITRPRQTAKQIAENLKQISVWAENWGKWSIEFINRLYRGGFVNKVEVNGLYDIGGYTIQKYIMGIWDIQPDEALIYETEIPEECRYWAIQLVDELYAALDLMNLGRRSCLNGHSAKLDSDGKFRAVLCAQDPGVPNWLDTAGYQRGGIFGRWLQCNRYPEPQIKVVKIAELRKHLPADTPVVSAEQRDKELRFHRESYQMRHRWN